MKLKEEGNVGIFAQSLKIDEILSKLLAYSKQHQYCPSKSTATILTPEKKIDSKKMLSIVSVHFHIRCNSHYRNCRIIVREHRDLPT